MFLIAHGPLVLNYGCLENASNFSSIGMFNFGFSNRAKVRIVVLAPSVL